MSFYVKCLFWADALLASKCLGEVTLLEYWRLGIFSRGKGGKLCAENAQIRVFVLEIWTEKAEIRNDKTLQQVPQRTQRNSVKLERLSSVSSVAEREA